MSYVDVAYYQRRLDEERAHAEGAADPGIAAIHEELANLYKKMIEALEGRTNRAA